MEKSDVTEFFLKYFEKNRIQKEWISEKTGIKVEKLSPDYKRPLTAEEFLMLCLLLGIKPEAVWETIKKEKAE